MAPQTREQVERLLASGAWLTSGQITVLIGYSRSTTMRRLRRGDIGWRESPGGMRSYDPADVRRLVAEVAHRHGGTDTPRA